MLLYYSVAGYRSFRDRVEIVLSSAVESNDEELVFNPKDLDQHEKNINMIVGTNNVGKTNLIDSIRDFKSLLMGGKTPKDLLQSLNSQSEKIIKYSISFTINGSIYFYEIGVDPISDIYPYEHFTVNGLRIVEKYDGNVILFDANDEPVGILSDRKQLFADCEAREFASMIHDLKGVDTISKLCDDNRDMPEVQHCSSLYYLDYFLNNLYIIGTESVEIPDDFDKIALFMKLSDTDIVSISTIDLDADSSEYKRIMELSNRDASSISSIPFVKKHLTAILCEKNDYYYYDDKNEHPIKKIIFHHKDGHEYSPSEESEGIRRLFEISPIMTSLDENSIFIIDELDRKLHTNLTKAIVSYFKEKPVECQQLIFTTHETSLLSDDILSRKDKWIIEKEAGISRLYNLSSTDLSEDIMSEYISGRYLNHPR